MEKTEKDGEKEEEMQKAAKEAELLTYGLTEKEAEKRLKEYGPNKTVSKRQNSLDIFLDHFQMPVIVLLFSIILWLWSGTNSVPALVALAFVLVMVIGETVRDINVRDSIKEIAERYSSHVIVIRDGARRAIPSSEIVPGDILALLPEMRVPADGTIIRGSCKVDESIFGREIVEKKRKERLEEKKLPAFGDKEEKETEYFRIFAGSFITEAAEGEILVKAENTGKETKLSGTLQREPDKKYLIIEKIEEVTERLTNVTLGIAVVIFIVLIYYKTPSLTAFSIAAASAVAGIPQSILLTSRVAFSASLKRIEGLAVRKDDLPERLSKISLICTEKLKALSLGELTAKRLWIDRSDVEVTGEGWSRAGKFKGIEDYKTIDLLTESLIITTSSVPIYRDNGEFYFNDPSEGALVTLAMKNNLSTETIRNENYCIERKTNPETGVISSVHINQKKEKVSYLRGPARKVAELCDLVYSKGKREKISKMVKEEIDYKIIEIAAEGFTPYAIAFSISDKGKTRYALLGLIGIYDPPKPEIREIINETKAAGIKIVILTGESGSLAVDFARQLGILTSDTRAIICDQLKYMRDPERKETIRKTVVFALATPEYKKMIIDELKEMGEKVLFVDSGTADISAIKSADVSISLESATEKSKYNSDAILLNDNFYWVPKSIEESKALGNIVIQSFYSLVISDLTILFLILLSAILISKPINVLQILFVNLVADYLIGIGLAMDRQKGSALRASLKFPSNGAFAFAISMAVYSTLAIFAVADYLPEAYFTSAVTAGIVLCAVANALNFSTSGSIFKTRPSNRILLAMTASIVFLLFIMYTPAKSVFDMLPLPAAHWGLLLMAAVSLILITEIKKALTPKGSKDVQSKNEAKKEPKK